MTESDGLSMEKLTELLVHQHELMRRIDAVLAESLEALDARPHMLETAAVVSRAKARCNDAAALITRQAIQLHGGIGFTEDVDVGLYVKRALTLNAWLGNSSHHRRRYARLMQRLGSSAAQLDSGRSR